MTRRRLLVVLTLGALTTFVTANPSFDDWERCSDIPQSEELDCFHDEAHGNFEGFEVGALLFRGGAGVNRFNHTGIFYRVLGSSAAPWIIHMSKEPGVCTGPEGQILTAEFSSDGEWDFLRGRCYYGAYYPEGGMTVAARDQVIDLAFDLMLREPSIGYPGLCDVPNDAIECDNDIHCIVSLANGIVEPNEIRNLRCDGFTEYVYEYEENTTDRLKVAIRVWTQQGQTEWSIAGNPNAHNDMPGEWGSCGSYQPSIEFAPVGQRGGPDLSQTTLRPLVIDTPGVASWSQDGTTDTVIGITFTERMFVTDLTAHRIEIRDVGTGEQYDYAHTFIEGTDCASPDTPFGVIGPLSICMTPDRPFRNGATIEIAIPTGQVRDAAGNPFLQTWSRRFGVVCDSDQDGDGVCDPADVCPSIPDPDQGDADGDDWGNACDNCPYHHNALQENSDGDLRGNACDNCPTVTNPTQSDSDVDNVGDECDTCTDTDGDGYGNPGFPANTCPEDECPADLDAFPGRVVDPYYIQGFGQSVCGVGDVDSDGVEDVAIGAMDGNGYIEVHSGRSGQIVWRQGGPGYSQTGNAVVVIGDLDGDAISDLAVGAHADDERGTDSGAVRLYTGGGTFRLHLTDPDGATDDRLGTSLGTIGDVDADGVPDVAAGAPLDDDPTLGINAGSVLIFSGRTGSVIRKLTDPAGVVGAGFGHALTGVTDLDGDLVRDLAIGSPGTHVVVLMSGRTGLEIRRLEDPQHGASGSFGQSAVVDAGDVDGDGTADIAVGSPYDSTAAGPNRGAVTVFSGATGAVIRRLIDGWGESGDLFGYSLTRVMDLNGDTVPELAVGAPAALSYDQGRVVVFSGATGLELWRRTEVAAYAGFGRSLSGLSDVDGDETPDLVVAAPAWGARWVLWMSGASGQGVQFDSDGDSARDSCDNCRTVANSNQSDVDLDQTGDACDPDVDSDGVTNDTDNCPGVASTDPTDSDADGVGDVCDGCPLVADVNPGRVVDPYYIQGFGQSVCGVGDVDSDGVEDVAIGAMDGNGYIEVHSGRSGQIVWRQGGPGYSQTGNAVVVIGDLDGDAISDLAVGAHADDERGTDSGAVRLYTGGGTFRLHLTDPDGATDDRLGTSLGTIGDVDADGVPDVAAGAPLDDDPTLGINAGSVLIFSGRTGSVIRKLTDPAGVVGAGFGHALTGVTDLDGDLVRDLAIGSPGTHVVVLMSGRTGLEIRRLEDPQHGASGSFGQSAVVDAGDVDGDGTADIAVGSPYDSTAAGPNRGAVTVFSGATGAVIRRLIDGWGESGDLFGYSLTRVMDLNGDTVPELAVGAPAALSYDQGRVVVFSGATGLELWRRTEVAAYAGFGRSLSGLSDVDGDETPDLVVAAPAWGARWVLWMSGASGQGVQFDSDGDSARDSCDNCRTVANSNQSDVDLDQTGDACDPDVDSDGVTNDTDNCPGVASTDPTDSDADGVGDVCDGCPLVADVNPGRVVDPYYIQGFGQSVCGVGDVDSDGVEDVAIGAMDGNGYIEVHSGRSGQIVWRQGGPGYSQTGNAVVVIGDLDGDAISDLAVGAHADDERGTDSGAVRLYTGGGTFRLHLTDPDGATDDRLGTSLGTIGDVDADGVPDVAAGAPLDDDPTLGINAGSVLIFSGRTGSVIRKLTDPAGVVGAGFGHALTGVTDLDGDLVRDLAIGSPGTHVVVLMSGRTGLEIRRLEDPQHGASGSFGQSAVVDAGDVDGDGTADIAVGSPYDSTAAGPNRGAVTVFSGATGAVIRRLIDGWGESGDLFGYSLTRVMDLNGDTVPELAVGAPAALSYDQGRVVVFSGATGLELWRRTEVAAYAGFGRSLSGLSDVDGDETPDLVVAAPAWGARWVLWMSGASGQGVQFDSDGDSARDSCDNCRTVANSNQSDVDLDQTGDACDNCISVPNADQANSDLDVRGDSCDCAPMDSGAFATPLEIGNLHFSARTTLRWDPDGANSGSATSYDLIRGHVSELPVGSGPSELCIVDGTTSTSWDDSLAPEASTSLYFLVRGTNACGAGTYGRQSDGAERMSLSCP